MKYLETYNIFEGRSSEGYEREIEYNFLSDEDEKKLKEYLYVDIIEEVDKAKYPDFKTLKDYSFEYDSLSPWGTVELQVIGKHFLNENNIEYTPPQFLNSLNKIVDEISEEENLFKTFDEVIIDYYEKNQEEWVDAHDAFEFTKNVTSKLQYILDLEKFNI